MRGRTGFTEAFGLSVMRGDFFKGREEGRRPMSYYRPRLGERVLVRRAAGLTNVEAVVDQVEDGRCRLRTTIGGVKSWLCNVPFSQIGPLGRPGDQRPSGRGPGGQAPSDPAPSDPAPSNPAPSDPAPSNPAPSNPAARLF